MCLWIVQGCTRAANKESSKIQIQLPTSLSKPVEKVVGQKISDPTAVDEFNCYAVFIGGPEAEFKNNSCKFGPPRTGGNQPATVSKTIQFGKWWSGGSIPGSTIAIDDVPSGRDRVVFILGMKVVDPAVNCVDFRSHNIPDDSISSNGFLIGERGRLEFKPGEDAIVSVDLKLDNQLSVSGCEGPEAPRGSNGDGDGDGGGGSQGPYLRFNGLGRYDSVTDHDLMTVGKCYEVKPSLHIGYGSPWIDPAGIDIDIDVTGISFGSFYATSSCSGATFDTLTIEGGNSLASSTYYFKAGASVTDATMENVVLSGNSQAISEGQQYINAGSKKIILNGPNRAIIGQCYEIKYMSHLFEGGALNTDIGGASGTLSDMANFYLRTNSDCASGSTANITPYTDSGIAHFKLMSPASVNLESYFSISGYDIVPFQISNSILGNSYDSLVLKVPDNKIVRGECTTLSVHVVNQDKGFVQPLFPIPVRVAVPKGAGVIYDTPNCSGAVVDQIVINPGTSGRFFSFKAHALPPGMLVAGKLNFTVDAGGLKLNGVGSMVPSNAQVDVVTAMEYGSLMADPPDFSDAEIIGSHEFSDGGSPSTYKYINLIGKYDELSDVECSATSGSGYSPCTAAEVDRSVQPYRYKWLSSNAANSIPRYVRFVYSGFSREQEISNSALYGSNFKVLTCDTIAAAGTGQPISTIAAAGAILCLPANSEWAKSSAVNHQLTNTHRGIIGHSSGTSVLEFNGYTNSLISMSGVSMSNDYYIANISLLNITSGDKGIEIVSPLAASPSYIHINNVKSNLLNGTARAIYLNNIIDPEVRMIIRNSNFVASGAGVKVIEGSAVANISMEHINIQHTGTGGNGIYIYNSASGGENIKLLFANISVGDATAFQFSNLPGVSNFSGNEISNSRFKRTGAGSLSPIVRIDGKTSAYFIDHNVFFAENAILNNGLLVIAGNSTPDADYQMRGNSFIQTDSSAPAIRLISSTVNISEFSKNSFSYANGTTSNLTGPLSIDGGVSFNVWTSFVNGGENIICSFSPVFAYTTVFTNSGSIGGGLGLGTIPSLNNNMDITSGRCKGP